MTPSDVVAAESGVDPWTAWHRARNAWGNHGLFPVSCVKELHLSGRSRQLSERSAQAQASDLPPYALGQARALMSLHAQLHEELDFREGDLITIVGMPESGWFEGELLGHRGVFPEGFVELLGPLRSPHDINTVSCNTETLNHEPHCTRESIEGEEEKEDNNLFSVEVGEEIGEEEQGVYGIALYKFCAIEPGELDFDVGDRICVVNTLDDGWLEGKLRGKSGAFPSRFVKIEDSGETNMEYTESVKIRGVEEYSSCTLDYGSRQQSSSKIDYTSEWIPQADHTVWDLDYFERMEEKRLRGDSVSDGLFQKIARGQIQPHKPKAHRETQRPSSAFPARPRLPPRPSLPTLGNRHHMGSTSTSDGNRTSNRNTTLPRPLNRAKGPAKAIIQSAWSKDNKQCLVAIEGATSNEKYNSLGKALVDDLGVDGHRQNNFTCHSSMNDSNGLLPSSFTLDALSTSAGDLETRLSQQLLQFERSLPGHNGHNATGGIVDDVVEAATENKGSTESSISHHFSILDFSNGINNIRGSSHSEPSLLQASFASSSLERRKTLRPPPPCPRIFYSSGRATYKPARPAPLPPPPSPRQPPTPNNIQQFGLLNSDNPEKEEGSMTETDERAENAESAFGDLALEQERQMEQHSEMEIEMERQREAQQEEQNNLLLRLQEVEIDTETYSSTASEIRAMLEEEDEESAHLQALENQEFYTYTLETLAMEQQQIQGNVTYPCYHRNIALFPYNIIKRDQKLGWVRNNPRGPFL
ncbi:hypothetical protein UPYG_G00143850 [Umbra pygmaea]|uniref:SH3 domain-containing protein n=1 Tax=Umbra pygmaea TaxID=75934 RepID=A0ABD0WX88_UMBPY